MHRQGPEYGLGAVLMAWQGGELGKGLETPCSPQKRPARALVFVGLLGRPAFVGNRRG